MAEIDSLEIKISAEASKANQAINSLVKNLDKLSTSLKFDTTSLENLGKINGNNFKKLGEGIQSFANAAKSLQNVNSSNFTKLANGLEKIASIDSSKLETLGRIDGNSFRGIGEGVKSLAIGLQNLQGIKKSDFNRLASGIERLASIQPGNIETVGNALKPLADGISILSNAKFDNKNLQNFINSLTRLANANVSGLANVDFSTLGNSIKSLAETLSGAEKVQQNTISMTNAIAKLASAGENANITAEALPNLAAKLKDFMQTMSGAEKLEADTIAFTQALAQLANAGKKAEITATELPKLGEELKKVFDTMSAAPRISENTIAFTQALAQLANAGGRANTSLGTLGTNLGKTSSSMNGLKNITQKATLNLKSMARQLLAAAGIYVSIYGAVKGLKNAIKSSMDYVETLNYFNAAFGQVAEKADLSSWREAGYNSANEYYNSFSKRAEQITQKMTGFRVSESGMLLTTSEKNLGINPEQLMNYQAMFGQMSSSMGVVSENALTMSDVLTKIGADLASVRNMDFDKVWTDMASGLAGMSRTLDKYGANIRNVNLQQKLNELGIEANISALNQNDKALLRTIILLDSTRYAWGDMANTIQQPANQLRLIQSNFANLSRTIGNIFLPIIAKVLPYINAMVIALQRFAEKIVLLLGFENFEWGGIGGGTSSDILSQIYDDTEDVAGALSEATEKAKEFKNQLLGFDEVNKLTEPTEDISTTDVGLSGGNVGALDTAFKDIVSEYQIAWNKAFEDMENKANNIADKIVNVFKKISDAAEPLKESVKKLWNEGFKELGNFKSKALKDFYNEFLKPIGKWTLGKGLPMLVDSINELLKKINWDRINNNLKKFWNILEPFTEGIGEGLINFFDKYSKLSATLINGVSFAVEKVLDLVGLVPTSVIKGFGEVFGELLGVFLLFKSLVGISVIITKIGTAFSSMFTLIASHPIVALTTAIVAFATEVYNFFAHPIELGFNGDVAEKFKGISESVKNAIDNVTNSINSYEESTKNTEAKYEYIKTVADKYIELSQNYTNLTDEQKQLLKSYADILEENVEGVEEYIDPITKAYQGTTDKLTELIDNTRQYYLVLGAKEKLTEFGTQLAELSIDISDATKKLNDAINDTPIDVWGNKTQSYLDWASLTYQANDNMYDSITGVKDSYRVLIDALEDASYSYDGLTDEQKKLYDTMYKVDEVFASYMDKIHEAAPNDLYALRQSSEQLSDKMTELEKVIASNGETITETSQTATTEISKVDKQYSLVTDNIQNNLSIATKNIGTEMSNIEKGFSKTAEGLKTDAKNAADKISETFENKGFGIGKIFGVDIGSGISEGFNENSNGVLNTISSLFSKINFKTSLNTVTTGLSLGFSLVPQYATGGFPEDGLFFANHNELVGQFSNGRTAVANNSQITEGIANAVYKAIVHANNSTQNDSQQPPIVKVYIGNKELEDITIEGINNRIRSSGVIPIHI